MKREHWGGRLAFVLAAAGSAVGLGNIWKFPYITGVHGGAAFILVYLFCIALVGMPIMVAELVVGRATQKSPIAAFRDLAPKKAWWLVGAMGVLAGYVILSFYSVVAGWTLEYLSRAVQGSFHGLANKEAVMELRVDYARDEAKKKLEAQIAELRKQLGEQAEVTEEQGWLELGGADQVRRQIAEKVEFEDLRAYAIAKGFTDYVGFKREPKGIFERMTMKAKPLVWHLIFMIFTMFVVSAGVGGGIEKASKVLMPILIVIILAIAAYGLTLPGSWAGVEFLISPDFSKLHAEAILEALGHAFFTLSLGMGAILTYGSYLGKEINLYKAGLMVVIADTLIALIAGMAIYPAVFAFGLDAGAGPGLIFVTLPVLFSRMDGGYVIGGFFFFALFVAALTSAISLLEVCVAHLIDERGWPRVRATLTAGTVILLLGIPSAIGLEVGFVGKSFFDCMDFLATNILLPLGGMFTALFVGWAWNKEDLFAALESGDEGLTASLGGPWHTLSRYVAPTLVMLVVLNSFGLLPLH
jgi:NSS family neurotransmitter:Na+ symporter